MQLDRVVLQKLQYPLAEREAAPAGWQWVTAPTPDSARQVYVLERVDGLIPDASGRVVATVNASADPISSDADSEHVTVSAPAGGSVVFSRLAWPGYTATLNGEPLQTKGLADIFLYVDLPPGTDAADLELTFRPPGERLGLAAMAGGVMVLIGLVVLDVRRRRRPSAPEFGSTTSSR